ncbi:MAG: transketolase [Candidatus Omnitrophica bacterium]|nr:transketolase [Candidatus Omnitrophota bacterium]
MVTKNVDVNSLKQLARQFRKEVLETINLAGSGHPGGSLSAVEIFISLYYYKMKHDPKRPDWEDRDRLIVSKGHCSPITYVTLANAGYFPKEELKKFRKLDSILQGHVSKKTPGVEFNTGSLGHGLSVANGLALGAKMLKKSTNIYCLLGDGEIQEGSIWEAAMTASHHKIDNVCAIVDYNKVQENGPTNDIKNIEPLLSKWNSFGWHVIEANGHDFHELMGALDAFDSMKDKPTVIIAHTIKGKGVSFMEGQHKWHGKAPKDDQLKEALADLHKKIEA